MHPEWLFIQELLEIYFNNKKTTTFTMKTKSILTETQKKYECSNCRKVLFWGDLKEGFISKDCPKCGERNNFSVERTVTESFTEKFNCVRKEHPMNR